MNLAGCHTALVTPFQKDGRLDERAFRRLVDLQISGGVTGLVPCGSTGEAATLTHDEYRRVIELTLEESHGRVLVTAGVASNATWKALELAREAETLGADALLLLAPYYNKPTQDGIHAHLRAIARATRLPCVVYNIPGRTAVNVAPATLARLAKDCPNVVAVKEAAGSLDQVSEILVKAPKGFTVLCGDDSLTLPMMSVGAQGVVSVLSNVAPKQTARLCARREPALHLKMFPLIKALFSETNPIPVKAALEMMGVCGGAPRLPLTPLTAPNKALLRRELKAFGLL
jgi:4-hydroxy-tetrahydrodipicolinate synthase